MTCCKTMTEFRRINVGETFVVEGTTYPTLYVKLTANRAIHLGGGKSKSLCQRLHVRRAR